MIRLHQSSECTLLLPKPCNAIERYDCKTNSLYFDVASSQFVYRTHGRAELHTILITQPSMSIIRTRKKKTTQLPSTQAQTNTKSEREGGRAGKGVVLRIGDIQAAGQRGKRACLMPFCGCSARRRRWVRDGRAVRREWALGRGGEFSIGCARSS